MMKKAKKGIIEKLIYNNKILAIFSLLLAIILWVTVKINYSTDTVRLVSDVKITLNNSSENSGYKYFVDDEQLYVDVEISGKAYNINSNVIDKSDIIVTASEVFEDSAGKKWLSLSGKISNGKSNGNAQIVSITPSTIAVYYDREITDTFNVEAQLTNDTTVLTDENHLAGNPVPSVKTVEITGPETIISQLNKVIFQASVDEKDLPLTQTKTLVASVKYQFNGTADSYYLSCPELEKNSPTVTISVKSKKEIPTVIKYINEPQNYTVQDSNVTIDPSVVTVFTNVGNANDRYIVETIDFRELSNKKNVFVFKTEDTQSTDKLVDDIQIFTVTIDFSDMERKVIYGNDNNVLFVNENSDYLYSVDFENGGLNSIILIGPEESLSQLSYEDIQIEINVSGLDLSSDAKQTVTVSNISILDSQASMECWVYGIYTAAVTVTPKTDQVEAIQ